MYMCAYECVCGTVRVCALVSVCVCVCVRVYSSLGVHEVSFRSSRHACVSHCSYSVGPWLQVHGLTEKAFCFSPRSIHYGIGAEQHFR